MKRLIESVLGLDYFRPWPDDGGVVAIPFVWHEGKAPLCLVLGPNGGGKSVFRRLVRETARRKWKGVECMRLSMEGRSGCDMMYEPISPWGVCSGSSAEPVGVAESARASHSSRASCGGSAEPFPGHSIHTQCEEGQGAQMSMGRGHETGHLAVHSCCTG